METSLKWRKHRKRDWSCFHIDYLLCNANVLQAHLRSLFVRKRRTMTKITKVHYVVIRKIQRRKTIHEKKWWLKVKIWQPKLLGAWLKKLISSPDNSNTSVPHACAVLLQGKVLKRTYGFELPRQAHNFMKQMKPDSWNVRTTSDTKYRSIRLLNVGLH